MYLSVTTQKVISHFTVGLRDKLGPHELYLHIRRLMLYAAGAQWVVYKCYLPGTSYKLNMTFSFDKLSHFIY